MASRTGFSCFIIGADALLIECAEILLREGHDLRGVISDTPAISAWARERNLTVVDPKGGYVEVLAREAFDYLFSITHLAIIPDEALAAARKGAINFHDGPLPRYAGLNAPAWALMQREAAYGVTWHRMAARLDAGAILKQVTFDIAPDETSLSLNQKCFAHAIESFAALVVDLSSDTARETPQDLAGRTYFALHRRPGAACVLDWERPALELEALVRALDFGARQANPLGATKVQTSHQGFIVTRAKARPSHGTPLASGFVVSLNGDAIGVATGEGVLDLTGASTLGGNAIDPGSLAAQLGLEVGMRFDPLSPDTREHLTLLDRDFARAETFWVERLGQVEPIEAPWADLEGHALPRPTDIPLALPEVFADQFGRTAAWIAAFCLYAARVGQRDAFSIGLKERLRTESLGTLSLWVADIVPLSLTIDFTKGFRHLCERVASELGEMGAHPAYLRDLVARHPELRQKEGLADGSAWPVCILLDAEPPPTSQLSLVLPSEGEPHLAYDANRISDDKARAVGDKLATLLHAAKQDPERGVGQLSLLGDEEQQKVLFEWNHTSQSCPRICVHHLIEEQAARTPLAIALACGDDDLSYGQLNERANQLAGHLRALGVAPEILVGIHMERSLDLVVAVLAVLKAGGAYVPLDPDYPPERIAFMIADAKLGHVLTSAAVAARLPQQGGTSHHRVVRLDVDSDEIARYPRQDLEGGAEPQNLAYVIYTSGSTGVPKGVMVEHANLMNFFVGMDARIPHDSAGTWLAVTSLSFDISVLELLWPLAHGFKVVIHRDRDRPSPTRGSVDFSLFYFASDDALAGRDKYELLLKGAKFADEHGFLAVWSPERHFHEFGGLYPDPAVTGAALAVLTERVQIRAGSVVLPLHHPARVVEAWSVVDNLSHGRVGISFASGWQPNDFVLRPESFKDAKKIMFRDVAVVKALWRGETVEFAGPNGDLVPIRTLPRPVQSDLPVWITTAGNVETYRMAGQIGANVLTHLLGQSIAELAPKIEAYRAARREHGHDPNTGVVSLMLHTFVGEDAGAVRALVREPLKRYLASSLELLKHYAWAFPAFSRPAGDSRDAGDELLHLSEDERDAMLEHAFDRYFETSGLFGTPAACLERVDALKQIGVSEIACLIDFGVSTPLVLDHLQHLDALRRVAKEAGSADERLDDSVAAEIERHQVTHMQCTPSMARMVLDGDGAAAALSRLRCLLIGGEALAPDLARTLRASMQGEFYNMYGPTETTVWSTMYALPVAEEPKVLIGRPIANTRVYLLDARGEPVPVGAAGELHVAGDGVARGYLGRAELTRERFVPDPFARTGRMYRTGDRARFREDGTLEFLGRGDDQIKIRGHRVEPGEIEAALADHPAVRESVVVMREDVAGDQRLVAYVVFREAGVDPAALREMLRARLPEFMVPAHVVALAAMPRTPNAKIDRRALPPLHVAAPSRPEVYVAPESEIELAIAELWQEILGREQIGIDDNFFDAGGHSLLVVKMHRRLSAIVKNAVPLTDLYRFPTIRALAQSLRGDGVAPPNDQGEERAERRREMNSRRRRPRHVLG